MMCRIAVKLNRFSRWSQNLWRAFLERTFGSRLVTWRLPIIDGFWLFVLRLADKGFLCRRLHLEMDHQFFLAPLIRGESPLVMRARLVCQNVAERVPFPISFGALVHQWTKRSLCKWIAGQCRAIWWNTVICLIWKLQFWASLYENWFK